MTRHTSIVAARGTPTRTNPVPRTARPRRQWQTVETRAGVMLIAGG